MTDRAWGIGSMSVAAVLGGLWWGGVRLNPTPSMPEGLWLIGAVGRVHTGDLVTACPPLAVAALGRSRGYIGGGPCPGEAELLLKPVAAVAGDTVTVSTAGIAVNGTLIRNSAAKPRDSHGRPMISMSPGTYQVAPDQVWLISGFSPWSFDSRYFGPVPVSNLRASASPLLVSGGKP